MNNENLLQTTAFTYRMRWQYGFEKEPLCSNSRPDNNKLHTEPRAARLFLLASLSPRPKRPGGPNRYLTCNS